MLCEKHTWENEEQGLENGGWTEELLEDGAVEGAECRAENLGEGEIGFLF